MRVLTFGWEFPPSYSGGLGAACHGLTRELVDGGTEVIFILPRQQEVIGPARFLFADGKRRSMKVREVSSFLKPYHGASSEISYVVGYDEGGKPIVKSSTIIDEVHKFAHEASLIAREEEFDIIHAHDWTAFLAGVAAKKVSGKPLIIHVHATSFDQAASDNIDPRVYKVEHEGFAAADKIVAVSEFTKNIIVNKHAIDPAKIEVVHNGCDVHEPEQHPLALADLKTQGKKIVMYHGRITIQKGVDYFVRAARRVVDVDPNVVFVISGSGDMTNKIIELVGQLSLSNNVIFAGALWDKERDRMYQTADLLVMPSVSEPFGLVPLEALQHRTPSLISKQSGVSEVLNHVLKVDFWDVEEMADKILSTLRYPAMQRQMVEEGKLELNKISWSKSAQKVQQLYKRMLKLS
ncbi:MAG: glycosyltransferase family 4 protein [Candidatus Nomurabacteria bacterium]|nr:glycosyltransferase family 4 protein [Candidatus Nomurabacteria bacterium]USN88041.1 MAG: glycosyltransferase family 4 protein [Candidatus Nomurabacteria bacterium]